MIETILGITKFQLSKILNNYDLKTILKNENFSDKIIQMVEEMGISK